MQDAEMAVRLAKLSQVETVSLGIVNKIRSVESHRVWVRSELTGNNRPITFNAIRRWSRGRLNSRVRRALAVALGLAQKPRGGAR